MELTSTQEILQAGRAVRPVQRRQLLRVLSSTRVGVLEAGGGYGKSLLAIEYGSHLGLPAAVVRVGPGPTDATALISTLRRAFAASRLSDLTAAMEGSERTPQARLELLLDLLAASQDPVLLVLDDVHALQGPDTAALVLRLGEGLPPPWSNGPYGYMYQWNRDGTPIVGAASSTYQVQTLDEGSTLTCTVVALSTSSARAIRQRAWVSPCPFRGSRVARRPPVACRGSRSGCCVWG